MNTTLARRLRLSGQVQGVGYRPFVYRLAQSLGVRGWVKNVTGAVEIHAEADQATLQSFAQALVHHAPAIALPVLVQNDEATAQGHETFAILPSEAGTPDIHVPPDYFVCPECLAELRNPTDRRYRYPFINCTQCGPRYTLITALPYDRVNTAMAGFPLCPACLAEYTDPTHRRFHAEPIACPVCGPRLDFVMTAPLSPDPSGEERLPLEHALAVLQAGGIVAVKGIGGYHLLCDARSDAAVTALRTRKQRPGKPLAVMFPNLDDLRAAVFTSAEGEALLQSPARPIVLLPMRGENGLSTHIAPGLDELGCLLPYSPLHALLLDGFGGPLVATSGNLSGEPVLTRCEDAETRLAPVADAFLHHNRPIVRPADDSVFRIIAGEPRPLRLGRGTSPLEWALPFALPEPVLALGSHMKNTVCLAWANRAVLSPHIGELDSPKSLETLAQVAADLQHLYQVRATRLLTDRHPGYGYQRWAREQGLPRTAIGHHRAHASVLAGEFPEVDEWIVFTWDGVGLGDDDTLWGGEAFTGVPGHWQHAAGVRPFRLPGGEKAGRAPWRSAAALLWETGQNAPFAPDLLHEAWQKGLNSPATSAVGRLFDAAATLIGVCHEARFEGEAPMRLEAAARRSAPLKKAKGHPEFSCPPRPGDTQPVLQPNKPTERDIDWAGWLPGWTDTSQPVASRALFFHQTLATALIAQAERLRDVTGIRHVGLGGGVFQNRLLTELCCAGLSTAGFSVHVPRQVPMNDAGLSFGQVIEFLHERHAQP